MTILRLGAASRGQVGLGVLGQGKAKFQKSFWRGEAWLATVGHGEARQGLSPSTSKHGRVGQGMARPGLARFGKAVRLGSLQSPQARSGSAWRVLLWLGEVRQGFTHLARSAMARQRTVGLGEVRHG